MAIVSGLLIFFDVRDPCKRVFLPLHVILIIKSIFAGLIYVCGAELCLLNLHTTGAECWWVLEP